MKKIALAVLASLLGLAIFVAPAFAGNQGSPSGTPKRVGIFSRIGTSIGNFLSISRRVILRSGSVVSLDSTSMSFTISSNGTTYTVQTDSSTRFRRLYWGTGSFSDLSSGDKVNVIGTWTDSGQTTIKAILVRDLSVQKLHGVFFGIIQSLGSNSFVLQSASRGMITVTTDSSTKFVDRKGQAVSLSNLAAGNIVRIRGLWDKTAKTLTEVVEVKDFNLPAK